MSEKLAEDWVALWQSELTAMAADRELRESWAAMVALWGSTTHAALAQFRDAAHRSPAAAQPPRPAPPPAAPIPGLDEIERLNRRIAELEQRLAALDRPKP
jgi:hypothetical protein